MARVKPKPEEWVVGDNKEILIAYVRAGASVERIAARIGVSDTTIYRWMDRNVEFESIIKHAREDAISEVENALYKSSVGHYAMREVVDKNGEIHQVREYYPPLPASIKYYLGNICPEKYRDRQEARPDQSALDRLDAILGSLTNAANEDLEDDVEENEDE